jgi:hypothetical protein
MCVAKRHNDETGADKEGETPRRRGFDEAEINEQGSLWPDEAISNEKNPHLLDISSDEEAPNEESWSRQMDCEGRSLLGCFCLRTPLRRQNVQSTKWSDETRLRFLPPKHNVT